MVSHIVKHVYDVLQPAFEKYRDQIIFAYLFGSAARGDEYSLSDVDLAVFLSERVQERFFDVKLSLYADFCRLLKRNDIDVVVLNTASNIVLIDEIVRHGAVIYDSDSELREDFELKILHQAIDFKRQRLELMGA